MPTLTIDTVRVEAASGASVLDAARSVGIRIPTLCRLEGVEALGGCRLCLVEVEGARTLSASCVTPVRDGMVVRTNTAKVRDARRTVLELLLSDHEGDCRTCSRGGDCELEELAHALDIRELHFTGGKHRRVTDASTPALVRDSSKCVMCRRCIAECNQIQAVGALWAQGRGFESSAAPAFGRTLASVACVQCGQCAAVCPTGAIVERDGVSDVWAALSDPYKHVVAQTAPAIRAALGECFGLPPGSRVTGKMVTALRRLGFARVFDTDFTADLTIVEEGNELLARLRDAVRDGKSVPLPQFTSCCPGWVSFAEYFHHGLLPNLSSAKSPQQMFGALAKTRYAETAGVKPENIVVVSVMPCTAKKAEAARAEMKASGYRDVDIVLTTRELARMIREAGIDFVSLPDGTADNPLGLGSGAADIFGNTGGVMEAALRTVHVVVTGRPPGDLHVKPIAGLEGVKEASVTITGAVPEWNFLEGVTLRVAVAHGLANAQRLTEAVERGESAYHFVEVMSCPGGCVGGGGQPRFTDDEHRLARISALYAEDEAKTLRMSHENPAIAALYETFLGQPLGERSHHLLHTTYTKRDRC